MFWCLKRAVGGVIAAVTELGEWAYEGEQNEACNKAFST